MGTMTENEEILFIQREMAKVRKSCAAMEEKVNRMEKVFNDSMEESRKIVKEMAETEINRAADKYMDGAVLEIDESHKRAIKDQVKLEVSKIKSDQVGKAMKRLESMDKRWTKISDGMWAAMGDMKQ